MRLSSILGSSFLGTLALAFAAHGLVQPANAQVIGGGPMMVCWPDSIILTDYGDVCPNDTNCTIGFTITYEAAKQDCQGCRIRGWGWVTCDSTSIPPSLFDLSAQCSGSNFIPIPCPSGGGDKGRLTLTCEECHPL